MSFTGFYLVLLGFTKFYWVLSSVTGFYWVLRGWIVDGDGEENKRSDSFRRVTALQRRWRMFRSTQLGGRVDGGGGTYSIEHGRHGRRRELGGRRLVLRHRPTTHAATVDVGKRGNAEHHASHANNNNPQANSSRRIHDNNNKYENKKETRRPWVKSNQLEKNKTRREEQNTT